VSGTRTRSPTSPPDPGENRRHRLFPFIKPRYEDSRSWETLREDEHGRLVATDQAEWQRRRRKHQLESLASKRIRRGLIRYVVLALDLSDASNTTDMKPSRLRVALSAAIHFVRDFYDNNPLSQLSILAVADGRASRVSEPGQSPEAQVAKLRAILDRGRGGGHFSLQQCLDESFAVLRGAPPYGHREVVLALSSLSSHDQMDDWDVFKSIAQCARAKVRVSVVGVGGELHIIRRCARDTGGSYQVATSEARLRELLEEHLVPPAAAMDAPASLVEMGFAERNAESGPPGFVGPECRVESGGFTCPRCRARVREIPARCHVCRLLLISSPHLAMSYHHLFPTRPFVEVDPDDVRDRVAPAEAPKENLRMAGATGLEDWSEDEEMPEVLTVDPAPPPVTCYGCGKPVGSGVGAGHGAGAGAEICLQCQGCKKAFCFLCDQMVHTQLHNCPGCDVVAGA